MDGAPVAFLSPNYYHSISPSTPSGRFMKAKRCHRRRPRYPPAILSSAASDASEGSFVVKDNESFEKFRADFFAQPRGRFRDEVERVSSEDPVLQRLRSQVEDREYSSEYIASQLLKKSSPNSSRNLQVKAGIKDEEEQDEEISIWEQDQNNSISTELDDEYEQLRKASEKFFAAADEDEDESIVGGQLESDVPNTTSSERLMTLNTKLMEVQTRRSRIDFREEEAEESAINEAHKSVGAYGNPGVNARLSVYESIKNAEVITWESAEYNSITRVAERVARARAGFPFIPKPIPGIEDAFRAARSVPCLLCATRFIPDDNETREEEKIFCAKCYADLFLKNDPVTGAAPEDRLYHGLPAAVRKEVERMWNVRRANRTRNNKGGRSIPVRRQRSVWEMAAENSNNDPYYSSSDTSADSGVLRTRANNESGIYSGGTSNIDSNGSVRPPLGGDASGTRADDWNVRASRRSMRTINPIRNLVQEIDVAPNPGLDLIKLSVGDPTAYGNLKVGDKVIQVYCEAIKSGKHNGYSLSYGTLAGREAVARRYSIPETAPLCADDVVLASGTSGALELCIGALCNAGDNILLARPGFPLFATIAGNLGVECRYYDTLPNRRWEMDLEKLQRSGVIDAKTAAIVVNNPSNPCGSVYSQEHILDILEVAEKYHLPVIADEVYADMAFSDTPFYSIGCLSKNVPVLSVGGISKQFVVPGWRLGWVCVHDRNGILERGNVRKGMRQLTTRMLVPNTPAQACLPAMLEGGTQDASFRELMTQLECNAQFAAKALAKAPGLRCIEPQGAMYMMAEIDTHLLGFQDDMQFTKALLSEESVFVLPGQCFQAPNFIRIVFCAPQFVLSEAFHRMRRFCKRHARGS